MLATSTGKTLRFILKEEREKPPDEQTTFILKILPARARMLIMDHMVSVDADANVQTAKPGTGMLAACQYGIGGWENLRDPEDGHEVRCRTQRRGQYEVVAEASLDRIAGAILELGAKIIELNRIGDDDDEHQVGKAPGSDDEKKGNVTTPGKSPASSTSERDGQHSATTTPGSPGAEPAQTAAAAQ